MDVVMKFNRKVIGQSMKIPITGCAVLLFDCRKMFEDLFFSNETRV